MEKFDLRGMEGGKRNAARHWNEYLEWKEALKDNDTVQEGWTHEYVDRNVLMAKVVPWLAGHLLSYSFGLNVILGVTTFFIWPLVWHWHSPVSMVIAP